MTKSELLTELCNNTYVMLKPSPIEGIGVFAVRDIAKGCRDMFCSPDENDKWISFSRKEVESFPTHAKFMVDNYCLFDKENYFVPDHGFKKIDIALFLNHSDTPNIISINDGDYFEAIGDIKAGEELVIDYAGIVDCE